MKTRFYNFSRFLLVVLLFAELVWIAGCGKQSLTSSVNGPDFQRAEQDLRVVAASIKETSVSPQVPQNPSTQSLSIAPLHVSTPTQEGITVEGRTITSQEVWSFYQYSYEGDTYKMYYRYLDTNRQPVHWSGAVPYPHYIEFSIGFDGVTREGHVDGNLSVHELITKSRSTPIAYPILISGEANGTIKVKTSGLTFHITNDRNTTRKTAPNTFTITDSFDWSVTINGTTYDGSLLGTTTNGTSEFSMQGDVYQRVSSGGRLKVGVVSVDVKKRKAMMTLDNGTVIRSDV